MSYSALARKWRPQNFNDFIGQSHARTALTNALQRQQIHHAYLFSGTRGVGKTSVARLFAKALSCQEGISDQPCGKCDACVGIKNNNYLDLIEIDAASRTKIEDTRELLDQVTYPPVSGRFKIYLIDEVHMLSTHSFNALLKTLEEPPEKTKFLLATTDPQKLPVTIQSRCLHLHLQHVSEETITQHLKHILHQENINYDGHSLPLLAKAASGSIRDALSLLEQALALAPHDNDHNITQLEDSHITHMLGTLTTDEIESLIQAIAHSEHNKINDILDALSTKNCNYHAIIEQITQQLFQHISAKVLKSKTSSTPLSTEQCHLYIQFCLKTQQELEQYPNQHMALSMLIIRMLSFKLDEQNLHDLIAQHTTTPPVEASTPTPNLTSTDTPKAKETQAKAAILSNSSPMSWEALQQRLTIKGLSAALCQQCTLQSDWQDNTWELQIDEHQKSMVTPTTTSAIHKAITQHAPHVKNITFGFTKSITPSKEKVSIPTLQKTAPKKVAVDDKDETLKSLQSTLQASIIKTEALTTDE